MIKSTKQTLYPQNFIASKSFRKFKTKVSNQSTKSFWVELLKYDVIDLHVTSLIDSSK